MKYLLKLKPNRKGRDYVVGDIHGAFDALAEALLRVGFDRKVDRLFAVGDLVDRGPQSAEVLEWLAKPWFYSVLGNHEDMLLNAYNYVDMDITEWNGGGWFLRLPREEKLPYVEAFRALPYAIQIGHDVGIVHAEVPKGSSWHEFVRGLHKSEKNRALAIWGRDRYEWRQTDKVHGIGITVHGHNVTTSEKPELLGNSWFIDLGAVWSGRAEILLLTDLLEKAKNPPPAPPSKPGGWQISLAEAETNPWHPASMLD